MPSRHFRAMRFGIEIRTNKYLSDDGVYELQRLNCLKLFSLMPIRYHKHGRCVVDKNDVSDAFFLKRPIRIYCGRV